MMIDSCSKLMCRPLRIFYRIRIFLNPLLMTFMNLRIACLLHYPISILHHYLLWMIKQLKGYLIQDQLFN